MTAPTKLNEFNAAEDPARRLWERLRWIFVHLDVLASERSASNGLLLVSLQGQKVSASDALLTGRVRVGVDQ